MSVCAFPNFTQNRHIYSDTHNEQQNGRPFLLRTTVFRYSENYTPDGTTADLSMVKMRRLLDNSWDSMGTKKILK